MDSQLNFLQSLGISPDLFTPEKVEALEEAVKDLDLRNPANMTQGQAMSLLKTIGIDPKKLNKGHTSINTGKKVKPNERCPCQSGKKYKKCCNPILVNKRNLNMPDEL